MNIKQVLDSTDVVKEGSQNLQFQSIALGNVTGTEQAEQVRRDIEKRATVTGPVLEEILRPHWEHWGLND